MKTAAELAQEHWNKTPLSYTERQRYEQYPWLPEAAEFSQHAGEDVLEIGCGSGCDLLQFAKNGANAIGIDISNVHLIAAKSRVGLLANVQYGDALRLPFKNGSFDYVYSHGVLHHISAPELAVGEMLRVLRPGGRFNIHVYSLWSESTLIYLLKHGWNFKRHIENSLDPVYIKLYTAKGLRKLFHPIELEITKYQAYHFPRLARYIGFFLVAKGRKS